MRRVRDRHGVLVAAFGGGLLGLEALMILRAENCAIIAGILTQPNNTLNSRLTKRGKAINIPRRTALWFI